MIDALCGVRKIADKVKCFSTRWLSYNALILVTSVGHAAPSVTHSSKSTTSSNDAPDTSSPQTRGNEIEAPPSRTRTRDTIPPSQVVPCDVDIKVTPSATRRTFAIGAAVVPGLFVNGTGHWVNGQPCTARRLVTAEAVGVGGMIVGVPVLWLTGGARYLSTPASLLTLGGFGLFLAAYGADIYGVSGAARLGAEPEVRRSRWETELGVIRVYSPLFDFNWLNYERIQANLGRASFSGTLTTAMDGRHEIYRFGASVRLFGALPNVTARDGSYFDLSSAMSEQRFSGLDFVKDSAEVLATGRLDLGRYGATLRGSFAEWSTGVQLSRVSYRIDGLSVPSDVETMLLGRVAFGAYLGRGTRSGSEAQFYYDHRRDDYAAGLQLPGYGNGMVGHFGLSARYFFSKQVGAAALFETGSAYVAGLSLLFRAGGSS